MSFLEQAAGRLKPSLETMVAAGAAIVTGAAVYMMPIELLQNAVIASGLPALLPPLDPPLGSRAKIGLALVAAGLAFGLVALLVRLLVGKPKKVSKTARLFERKRDVARPKASAPVAEELPSAPKLRWRDRHPDAPARAPLSIGREIGSPDEPPMPGFAKAGPVFEPEPVAEAFEAPLVEEPVYEAPVFVEPEPVAAAFEPEPEPVVDDYEPEPAVAPAPVSTHPAWLDADVPQPGERSEPTLAELLERLEAAMARRPATAGPVAAEVVAELEERPAEVADDRLRSALENLKRFAPGRG